ncbi:zinc finger CCHC domain-containing protein 17-like isoform X1 [Schistocerca serialis cubense]|uniref:zinc finger CCHC domain-containing protein 17-like isoform X1 n=1 Tax=Schistocerca serialis cubense TaxID=2023355 RepID=UPI00214F0B64|nr:zinc finger CCHC domain-containing protein 17-like isoform X1 [Schistocerca serialis cubense]
MMKSDENVDELLNTIFLGEVRSVHNYGAFVTIPGRRDNGLIHRSQISKSAVDDANDVLQRGERVWCKVIGVTDEKKISLSMKVVDQGTGKDLDPNGVQIHQDELKRKSFDPSSRRKVIELEAVLKTTCTKCGTYGHLAKDCFKSPDGKTYELLPDDDNDDDVPGVLAQLAEEAQKTKHSKKAKKIKKHKKSKSHHKKSKKSKKKRKYASDTSDSEQCSEKSASSSPNNERKIKGHHSEKSRRKRSHSLSPESVSKKKKQ